MAGISTANAANLEVAVRPQRVVLLGLDSMVPGLTKRFVADGYMPNLRRLIDRGFWTETMPTLPPWTPPGWASVATGAWPSTHGIEGFGVYVPGEPLWQQHEGFDSSRWRAEAIWEAAARAGKRSTLLKYPGMWPHKDLPLTIQVGGDGGYGGRRSRLDITHSQVFGTNIPDGPHSVHIALERSDSGLRAVLPIRPLRNADTETRYMASLIADGSGPIAVISDASGHVRARLRPGQWSEPIVDEFNVGSNVERGAFFLKLLVASPDLDEMRIYMSQNHPIDGYSTPSGVAADLFEHSGPIFEYSEAYFEFFDGLINEETYLEISDRHSLWHEQVMRRLADRYPTDLFVTQNHIIDNSQHTFWGGTDTGHPDNDPQLVDHYFDVLGRTYSFVDRLIGAASDIAGDDGLLVVTGDHGHEPRRFTFHINNWLAKNGYLAVEENGDGQWIIHWDETRAVAMGPIHIMLNVRGRNPDGIVDPGLEYARLREELIDGLCEVRHDSTGKRVIQAVFRREDVDMLGLYGEGVGDIIYVVKSGFDVGASMRADSFENFGLSHGFPMFETSRIFKEITSQHCSVIGFTPSNRTWTLFAGLGVHHGATRRVPIRLPDIAPTICHLAGWPLPAQAEGGIISDVSVPD